MSTKGAELNHQDANQRDENVVHLWERNRRLGLELDSTTGLPSALLTHDGAKRYPVRLSATLITEGDEVERHPFGLAYANTVDLTEFTRASRPIVHCFAGSDELFTVPTAVPGWDIFWEYRFRASAPRLELTLTVAPTDENQPRTLRDLHLQFEFVPENLHDWIVEAPVSAIRPGLAADAIDELVKTSDSTYAGSGIVLTHNANEQSAVLVWPFSRTERSRNSIRSNDGALQISSETGLAGRITQDERLHWAAVEFDVFDADWDEIRPSIHSWLETLGISRPEDTATWIPGSTIFEVQIGTSVFWNDFEYSPYPTMRDLYNDLGRIAGLGFDCIQIMPRQPFPSYNVYDYSDITTSYGDEDDLRLVVDACHSLGMRVILDILMHGVIDADIIHQAADRVRTGPYFARLDEGMEHDPESEQEGYPGHDYLVAWSRHILDFEHYWAEGSPGTHPLVSEHPEWFVRKSDGEIIGVYTKAFDAANIAWQEYFTESALDLVRKLGIDGFRFDAPTYNEVPNWSPATEKRASASQLGSVELFSRLRPQMKAIDEDAMLYTEPSGVLFRDTMDITYNYDEHWLINAALFPKSTLAQNPLSLRNARDLARWLRDKEATLPAGSITARHIDSHDTFWWPLHGKKWRREQYGLPATRALLATFSLIGGVYMTFVGGEIGVEDDIRCMNRLRRELPEIRLGRADFDAVNVPDDRIFAVAREHMGNVSLVLVNLSNTEIETRVSLDASYLPHAMSFTVKDVWNDMTLSHNGGYSWQVEDFASHPITFRPYQACVLTIRQASL